MELCTMGVQEQRWVETREGGYSVKDQGACAHHTLAFECMQTLIDLEDILLENEPHASMHCLLALAIVLRLQPRFRCIPYQRADLTLLSPRLGSG